MMTSKCSTDLDGISSKLLKAIQYEIERHLAHIFGLSLANVIFPAQLKASRTQYLFHRPMIYEFIHPDPGSRMNNPDHTTIFLLKYPYLN
jgi:hypothetical protein